MLDFIVYKCFGKNSVKKIMFLSFRLDFSYPFVDNFDKDFRFIYIVASEPFFTIFSEDESSFILYHSIPIKCNGNNDMISTIIINHRNSHIVFIVIIIPVPFPVSIRISSYGFYPYMLCYIQLKIQVR